MHDLYESGVSIDQSLAIAAKVINHRYVREGINKARVEIKKGAGMATALEKSQVFPPMVITMVRVGEESGDLSTMLKDISDYSRAELELKIDQLTSLIEPLLIILIGIVVGFVIIGILLPMYEGMRMIQ
jgi:type IV pilus assembly protein PilC